MKHLNKLGIGILMAVIVIATSPLARAVQLSGMGGYQFGGKIETTEGDIKLGDAAAFALAAEFPLKFKTGTSLLLMWAMQPTDLKWEAPTGDVSLGDITAHYWHGGLLYNLKTDNPDLVPFTMLTLGATGLYPSAAGADSKTKFSFNFGAGLKYSVNPKVAIRLQADLYATMLTSDAWVGVGTGGASVSMGGNAMLQGAVMAGVTIGLGGSNKQAQPAAAPAPATQPPPATPPPATQPPATQPPATTPPATEPPTTQPPATTPPM